MSVFREISSRDNYYKNIMHARDCVRVNESDSQHDQGRKTFKCDHDIISMV